ncbi:putative vesicle-associated membrane protein 726 [Tanacetum coccineum]|uniref:Vesicle-associated membrane protein 726 n=1 Tax=Tanacetum coccineum TaxID=301880 RepID=A0ABQ5ESE0_9ASTR
MVESAGRELPIGFLERIKDEFYKKYGTGKGKTADAKSLNKEVRSKMKKEMHYCISHLEEISKIAKVKAQESSASFGGRRQKRRGRTTFHQPFKLRTEARISRGTSELYTNFIWLLKDISCNWRSVKLALRQILVKSAVDNYGNEEMLLQLSDLEAAKSKRPDKTDPQPLRGLYGYVGDCVNRTGAHLIASTNIVRVGTWGRRSVLL